MDWNKYTISLDSSVLDVLKQIDKTPDIQTVFVLNTTKEVVGSITDGDIRRGLISGLTLVDPISKYLCSDFQYIIQGKDNFQKLKLFRDRKLKAIPLLSEDKKLVKIIDFTTAKSILPVDAVIMAGGIGSRLKPLTNDTPKPLLKVGEKEIISYNFDRLYQFGITRQYVSINYLGEQIEIFCSNYNENIHFRMIKENEYLGTAGALSLIDDFHNDTVLLMNSDLLTNIDYEDFYKTFLKTGADIMVASIPYQVNLPYAIFDAVDRNVNAFKEKPNYTYFANAGIYLIKKEVIKLIPKSTFFNATDLMDLIIKSNRKLIHYPIRGYWLDIGKHEDFDKAQKDILHIKF